MGVVVAIEPNDDLATQYAFAFRMRDVYSHPDFHGPEPKHSLKLHQYTAAVPQSIHPDMRDPATILITGVGHGAPGVYTGHRGARVLDSDVLDSKLVTGKIIHLLSCRAGILLGRECVALGARAFWGYTNNFAFYMQKPQPRNPIEDPVAEQFLGMDTIIDQEILAGSNATEILDRVTAYVTPLFAKLQQKAATQRHADQLLDNFAHLIGPIESWGDATATL